jgi:hypothetical protein
MIKFSPANVKIKALKAVAALAKYLPRGRRVYSFDLQSGRTCPFAKICRSRVKEIDGKRKIVDGPHTKVRCFSASQEATYTNVYKLRKHNADILMAMNNEREMFDILNATLPKNAGVVRIHVAGDFFNQNYFDAWVMVAMNNPHVLFYAYTKSLRYWVSRIGIIPANMILTASEGGSEDYLIEKHNLRKAVIVFNEQVAADMELEIDHTDEHAANPETANQDFALLIHGIQPAGSEAAAAIRELKRNGVEFAYSR